MKQNSRDYFKSLKIVHLAMLIGLVLFALVTLYLNLIEKIRISEAQNLRNVFLIIAGLLALNGFVTGNFLYKNKIRRIKTYSTLVSKMPEYRGAMLIRLAMLEGATLFAIIVYLITADQTFLILLAFLVIYFILLHPTKEKIAYDLELNSNERSMLDNPDEIIAEM